MIFILLILLFLILLYIRPKNNIEGFLYTFNGRAAIDDQYHYDKLFDDVTYYSDEYDPDTGATKTTGWEKCVLQNLKTGGKCVEFGLTGDTYYFPY